MPIAALGQFCAVNNLLTNLASCTTLIQRAAAARAAVLFLPEASDYISSSPAESLALCQPADRSPFVLGLCALAKQHRLAINVGIHEPAPDGARVRNVSVWIDEEGGIVRRYQKVHVFDVEIEGGPRMKESLSTEPGSSLTRPFDTALGKLGMLICFDLRFPEPATILTAAGAHLLAYPSAFTVPTGRAHWEPLLRARAIENQAYVFAAAQMGRHNETRVSYGRSMIVDPWGRVVASCRGLGDEEEERRVREGEVGAGDVELCTAEVDVGVVERVRREVPMRRRFDVYPELKM